MALLFAILGIQGTRAAEPGQELVGHVVPLHLADNADLQIDSLEKAFGKAIEDDKELKAFLDQCEAPYKKEAGGGYGGRTLQQITIASTTSRDVKGLDAANKFRECIAVYVSFHLGHRLGADQVAGFFIICDITAIENRHYKDNRDDAGTVVSLKADASIVGITNTLDATARYATKLTGR